MPEAYKELLSKIILRDDRFVEAVFRNRDQAADGTWREITIRPVAIKGARHLQFMTADGLRETAKNYHDQEAGLPLGELLDQPLKSIRATTTQETLHVQFSKKGRPIIHRQPRQDQPSIPLDLAHDRRKPYLLAEDQPVPFLTAIGVMTAAGRVRADQQRKFRQINEFLRIMDETGGMTAPAGRPLRVADLGCGSAALTFATYHYLNVLKGIPTTMVGVDAKSHLMTKMSETATALGWDALSFNTARIIDFDPGDETPDIVLALHACDTATDEALARAVHWNSRFIFSAPCCHHHLQAQLVHNPTPTPFEPVMRHGILRERLGDILTDTFRALILRLMGYRADVLEFIPIEHTPKNLMIRAVNTQSSPSQSLIDEYHQMKSYWKVTPYLETLLHQKLVPILGE